MMRFSCVFALAVGLCACGSQSLEEGAPELFTANPTYLADIRPMLDRTCVSCHDGFGTQAGGVELDRYSTAFGARVKIGCTSVSSELLTQFSDSLVRSFPLFDQEDEDEPCFGLEAESMPPGATDPLTPREQVLLLRWIETGAPR